MHPYLKAYPECALHDLTDAFVGQEESDRRQHEGPEHGQDLHQNDFVSAWVNTNKSGKKYLIIKISIFRMNERTVNRKTNCYFLKKYQSLNTNNVEITSDSSLRYKITT